TVKFWIGAVLLDHEYIGADLQNLVQDAWIHGGDVFVKEFVRHGLLPKNLVMIAELVTAVVLRWWLGLIAVSRHRQANRSPGLEANAGYPRCTFPAPARTAWQAPLSGR